ncbi:phage holin family protein [Aestuariivirga litoralis]|uniref:Phage holin family protein n=1 Tax=Aestuariivirga litoralis TaxID=2650924 RepID=A0A2W2AWA8_9HYPH|nr:phage holin family protein [Aestuariivirga litoralis]PZF78002.1 phage holin family protein [Aestuariivirga litoralis]
MASAYDNRPPETKPVSELISDALGQFSRLVRNEVALARAEMTDKAKQVARGGAMLGLAAFVALPALGVLMLALAAGLHELGLAWSLSYLITAVVGFVIAGMLAMVGMSRLKAEALVPSRTINQLHRDVGTMKEHM